MIKLQNYTPEIYYKESRDFQFIGRLFDLVLNAAKTEADLLYNIPLSTNSDEKLLELLAMTLGFKPKHQYNAKQLKAVCSVLSEILRNKGSIKALKIACEALFNSMDINQALDYNFTDGKDKTVLNLYMPPEFEDITILNDLLTYVLPAGMSCNIIKELHIKTTTNTDLGIQNLVTWNTRINSNTYSQIPRFTDSEKATTNLVSNTVKTRDAIQALIKGTVPGFSVNSEIIKLEDNNNG
jgi:hypothetical protein